MVGGLEISADRAGEMGLAVLAEIPLAEALGAPARAAAPASWTPSPAAATRGATEARGSRG